MWLQLLFSESYDVYFLPTQNLRYKTSESQNNFQETILYLASNGLSFFSGAKIFIFEGEEEERGRLRLRSGNPLWKQVYRGAAQVFMGHKG